MVLLAENDTASPFPSRPGTPGQRRGRRVRRAVGWTVGVALLGATGTGLVLAALNHFDSVNPATERCGSVLDGTEWYLSPAQADNAALITGISLRRALPARAATIGLATSLQESKLINITYGDRDSVGLFQQRPSQGWGSVEQIMDPVYSTNAFYDGLVKVAGYEDMEITVAAQTVQRSGYPDAYAQHETRSRAWASALTGNSAAALSCELADVPGDSMLSAAQAGDLLAGRLGRDLGLAPAPGGSATDGTVGRVVVDASPLAPDDPARGAWATGQWAVATAAATHVIEVRVSDRVWTREEAAWTPADSALPTGQVTITQAVAAP
ncbi:hypothetical protein [Antribacter gilvus]|uniref:hypothetical protein n=1 Tax=Antribacter gilvus TaxID=2304675 RepID=UPI001F0BF219|nr:hypothetical protein [Antribacter gilvus]